MGRFTCCVPLEVRYISWVFICFIWCIPLEVRYTCICRVQIYFSILYTFRSEIYGILDTFVGCKYIECTAYSTCYITHRSEIIICLLDVNIFHMYIFKSEISYK